MLRIVGYALSFLAVPLCLLAEPHSCSVIRGRAHHPTDGAARIWHIGTHHDFMPDQSTFQRVDQWLDEGVDLRDRSLVAPLSTVYLFGDFLVCPTEPFKAGAVQEAEIRSIRHRRYVRIH